jgi:hypothetical protein
MKKETGWQKPKWRDDPGSKALEDGIQRFKQQTNIQYHDGAPQRPVLM